MHLDSYTTSGDDIIIKVPVGTDKKHHNDKKIDSQVRTAFASMSSFELITGVDNNGYSESNGKFFHEYILHPDSVGLSNLGKLSKQEQQAYVFERFNQAIEQFAGYPFP